MPFFRQSTEEQIAESCVSILYSSLAATRRIALDKVPRSVCENLLDEAKMTFADIIRRVQGNKGGRTQISVEDFLLMINSTALKVAELTANS